MTTKEKKWTECGSYPNWDLADMARNQLKAQGVYDVKIVSRYGVYIVLRGE